MKKISISDLGAAVIVVWCSRSSVPAYGGLGGGVEGVGGDKVVELGPPSI